MRHGRHDPLPIVGREHAVGQRVERILLQMEVLQLGSQVLAKAASEAATGYRQVVFTLLQQVSDVLTLFRQNTMLELQTFDQAYGFIGPLEANRRDEVLAGMMVEVGIALDVVDQVRDAMDVQRPTLLDHPELPSKSAQCARKNDVVLMQLAQYRVHIALRVAAPER